MKETETEFWNKMENLVIQFRAYGIVASFNLVILSVRVLMSLSAIKYVQVVTKALSYSKKDMLYFIFMLLVLLLAFVLLGHIAFGTHHPQFQDFKLSFIETFYAITGSFAWEKLNQADSVIAPLFALLFLVLFFLMIINIFISIERKAFLKAKGNPASTEIAGICETIKWGIDKAKKKAQIWKILKQKKKQEQRKEEEASDITNDSKLISWLLWKVLHTIDLGIVDSVDCRK